MVDRGTDYCLITTILHSSIICNIFNFDYKKLEYVTFLTCDISLQLMRLAAKFIFTRKRQDELVLYLAILSCLLWHIRTKGACPYVGEPMGMNPNSVASSGWSTPLNCAPGHGNLR